MSAKAPLSVSAALYMVVHTTADGNRLINLVNSKLQLKQAVRKLVDVKNLQLADGGWITKDNGRLMVYGNGSRGHVPDWFRWIRFIDYDA